MILLQPPYSEQWHQNLISLFSQSLPSSPSFGSSLTQRPSWCNLSLHLHSPSLSILRVVTKVTRSRASMTSRNTFTSSVTWTTRTTSTDDDDFDKFLEEAVKTYQLNFHLKPTGTLDDGTISKMMMPRCGFPDIINGTTSMRSAKINFQHRTYFILLQNYIVNASILTLYCWSKTHY